jgi:isopropylmalate/homocitrate/citramalate synthase
VNPQLAIHDITLREGEEAAEVNFSLEQKLRIYDRLVETGLRYIQGGLPAKSKVDARFIREVTSQRSRTVEIEALVHIFTDDWKQQIDAAVTSGADRLSLMYPLSRVRLEKVQKATAEEALARIREGVAYASAHGVKVRFSPPDGTRAEVSLLLRAFRAAGDSGADIVSITDTVGCMTPHGMRYLVTAAVRTGLAVQVHCHNDYGLAMSNALAAVEAGAAAVDTSTNGLGERAGNLVMAEFVTTLQYLYGVDLGIDLTKLTGLSQLVSELAGVPMASTQPLTGSNSFAHKLDTHIYGLDKTPDAYEFIAPAAVGNTRRIVLGKYSGPYVVRKKLAEAGFAVADEDVPVIVHELHERATILRRSISYAELLDIAQQVASRSTEAVARSAAR